MPLFGARHRRHIRCWLFILGFAIFLPCRYRFLVGKKVRKAALSSRSLPNGTAFGPSPLLMSRTPHTIQPRYVYSPTHSDPNFTTPFRHNHGSHKASQQVTAAPARCTRTRMRHANTRRDKGHQSPADSPATHALGPLSRQLGRHHAP